MSIGGFFLSNIQKATALKDITEQHGHFRGLSLPAMFKKTEPDLPETKLAQQITQLAGEVLFNPQEEQPISPVQITELNQRFAWQAARLNALFNTLYREGETEHHDHAKLKEIQAELKKLEVEIRGLTPKGSAEHALHRLNELQSKVSEVQTIATQLYDQLRPVLLRFDDAWKDLNACINSPENKGLERLVLGYEAIYHMIRAITDYKKTLKSLPEGPLKEREITEFERNMKLVKISMDELSSSMKTSAQEEMNSLKKAWAKQQNLEIIRQFNAFANLLGNTTKLLEHLEKKPQFNSLFLIDFSALKVFLRNLRNGARGVTIQRPPAAPLEYGTQEWYELSQKRKGEDGFLKRTLQKLDSETWSDRTKDVVYRLLVASQLVTQGMQFWEQIDPKRLNARAETLQRQVKDAVPEKAAEAIDRETAHLGTLLSDQYRSPELLGALSKKRSPAFKEALQTAKTQFGNTPPTTEQVLKFINAYRTQEMVRVSPSGNPLKQLSLGEWWNLLTAEETAESKTAPPTTDFPLTNAHRDAYVYMDKLRELALKEAPSLVGQQRFAGLQMLQETSRTLTTLHAAGRGGQLTNIHRDLDQAITDMPPKDCSLPHLASWMQKVEDLSYGVSTLKKSLSPSVGDSSTGILNEFLKFGEPYPKIAEELLRRELIEEAFFHDDLIPGYVVFINTDIDKLTDLLKNLGQYTDTRQLIKDIVAKQRANLMDPTNYAVAVDILKSLNERELLAPDTLKEVIEATYKDASAYPVHFDRRSILNFLGEKLGPTAIGELKNLISADLNGTREQRLNAIEHLADLVVRNQEGQELTEQTIIEGLTERDTELYLPLIHLLKTLNYDVSQDTTLAYDRLVRINTAIQTQILQGLFSENLDTRLRVSTLLNLFFSYEAPRFDTEEIEESLSQANRNLFTDGENLAVESANHSNSETRVAALKLTGALLLRRASEPGNAQKWFQQGEAILLKGLQDPVPDVRATAMQQLNNSLNNDALFHSLVFQTDDFVIYINAASAGIEDPDLNVRLGAIQLMKSLSALNNVLRVEGYSIDSLKWDKITAAAQRIAKVGMQDTIPINLQAKVLWDQVKNYAQLPS